jgi:hypothetical protein
VVLRCFLRHGQVLQRAMDETGRYRERHGYRSPC